MLRTLACYLFGETLPVRSSEWPRLRKSFLQANPKCAVCGTAKQVVPHHIEPVHIRPDLELCWDNLISLCESNGHHLTFGHCGSWRSVNESVRFDVAVWNEKYRSRPYQKGEAP